MKPIVGLDIGGSYMKAGLVKNGTVVFSARTRTAHKNEKEFFKAVFKLIDEVLKGSGLTASDTGGIGVSIAGMVLADTGVLVSAVNLGLSNVPVCKIVREKYGVDVRIGNDVGMFALAEHAASGLDNLVYVAIGTGINAGVINGGRLFAGAAGASIEFGHSTMDSTLNCTCGQTGCVECYVSGKAIMAAAKINNITASRPEDVFAVCGQNPAAKKIVNDFLKRLTDMLVNVCNIYRPQVIFLGGGVAPLVAPYIEGINADMKKASFGYKNAPKTEVKISELSALGGVLGACLLFDDTQKKPKDVPHKDMITRKYC